MDAVQIGCGPVHDGEVLMRETAYLPDILSPLEFVDNNNNKRLKSRKFNFIILTEMIKLN